MAMSRSRRLGLDELMIVNPSPRAGAAAYVLGNHNTLYRVEGLAENERPGRFFLGDDGTLYEVIDRGKTSGLRRYRR